MMFVTNTGSGAALRTSRRRLGLSSLLIAASCAASSTDAPRAIPENAGATSAAPPTTASYRSQDTARTAREEQAAPAQFVDGLTWPAVQRAALSRHPELLAAQAELDALAADISVAGLRPNPSLNVQVEDVGNEASYTGPNGGQTTVMVTHTLERGGKRAARKDYTKAQRTAAQMALAVRTQAVLSDARVRYLSALSAQEQLERQSELLEDLTRSYEAVSERVQSGKSSEVDRQQFALLTTHARLEQQSAEARARTARLQLAQLLDGRIEFEQVEGRWPTAAAPPSLEDLIAQWKTSPGLTRIESELAISQAAVQSATSATRQDWDLFAGFRKREQTNDWTATFGFDVPIPVFNGGRSAVEAARARRRQSIHQSEAAQRDAYNTLNRLHGALSSSYATLEALGSGALEDARWLHESIREGYAQGRFELLQVIEAQKSYFQLMDRHRQAQIDHHSAWAELESLLGQTSTDSPWSQKP